MFLVVVVGCHPPQTQDSAATLLGRPETLSTAPVISSAPSPAEGFGAVGESDGTVYFVSDSGADENGGTDPTMPFATLERALAVVRPGDTIALSPGTYEAVRIENLQGQADAPITIRGDRLAIFSSDRYDRQAAFWIEDSAHVILDGLVVTRSLWGIMGERLQYVTIRNCEAYDIGQEAIHVRDRSHHLLIADNTIHDTGQRGGDYARYGEGVYVGHGASGGEDDGTHHVLVHHNEIFRTASEGIDLKRGLHDLIAEYNHLYDIDTRVRAAMNVMEGATGDEYGYIIRGNRIHNVSGHHYVTDGTGIRIFGGGVQVYNNVVYDTRAYGIRSEGDIGGDRVIYNNTVFNGGSRGDIVDDEGGADLRNNIGSSAPHNIPSDAGLFVNAAAEDFRLRETASAAIDQGLSLEAVPIDITGTPRPQGTGYDLGAYENW